jgi:alpha-D-xyloside xylohydrolase
MDGVIGRYRALTGPAALLPRWAYGYWQSKESYTRQVDLIAVVDEYRRRRLPLDTIVLDFKYWGDARNFSGMRFDPATFPDPKAMLDHVHSRNVHLLASIWPAFGTDTELYREMSAAGYLLPGDHWSGGKAFDVSDPRARDIYWRHIKRGLIDIGVDGLWTDGNEPELRSTGERYGTAASYAANRSIAAGPIGENLLTYSWYQAKGLSEALRRDVPAKRPVILSRSAYAGQQAFGAVTWSGDIFASWGTLANQIVAALNFSVSGIPWWTCDIGAFLVFHRYPEGLADPAYKELYVRWFQFGAFLPVFRAHGTHVSRELWQFGEAGDPFFDALEAALRQRYRLMPYIYSAAAATALRGDTLLRPLVMDYPDQPEARDQSGTFMFGRDLLVRIVDRPLQYASRNAQEFLPSYAIQGVDAPAASIAYYEGANFDWLVWRRLTDDIKMSWAGDLPKALEGKPYSLRWTGRLVAQESGAHRFSLIGKGALRLAFDGRTVVDGRSQASVADDANGGVSFRGHEGDAFLGFDADLIAGRAYDFILEQRQETPDAVSLWFEWLTPTAKARQRIPKSKTIPVTLPEGRDWYDFRSGERHRGGLTIDAPAPLLSTPVFARAGAILPLIAGADRTGSLPELVEISVFAGHDGAFTLYDDFGDGQGHLNGEHAQIPLTWDDRLATLHVGARIGRFPGMRARHRFAVTVFDGTKSKRERTLNYDGTPTTARLANGNASR